VVYVTHDQIEAMTLATRIAVMKDGRIEQLGTPSEIYDRPATLYVATFVGAPPMNLLKATVENGSLKIDGTECLVPLPSELTEKPAEGRKLILGIRPETLRVDGSGSSIAVRCDVAELTGPELVVTAFLAEQRLMASLPPRTLLSAGQELALVFDPEAIHLFDPETGLRCS
jgi:multiple sugar transport system ATP-binding protein